jgi:hypothetical protein
MSNTRIYYAKIARQAVSVPKRDTDGNVIYKVDRFGNPIYSSDGDRIAITKTVSFITKSSSPENPLSFLVVDESDKDLIDCMERLVADTVVNHIISEEQYLKDVNPFAFDLGLKVQALSESLTKKDNEFAVVVSEKDKTIEALMERLKKAESLIPNLNGMKNDSEKNPESKKG